jgi:hypothetical protein
MTLRKPTLIIQRLLAKRGSHVAYDESFHQGINILNGCNGGGKTSVLQLLVYGMGYEVPRWKDEAAACDRIYVGLKINGEDVTLKRLSNSLEKQSMDICYLPLDEAILAPVERWNNHPYAISNRSSFSQELFSMLELPEAKADSNNNNITIHQVLRLLYSDQSNIAGCVFNVEPFDSAFKRESIGKYLLGLYDNDLYNAKISLVVEEKKLDKLIAKLQAIHSVVGKTSFSEDFVTIESLKSHYYSEISRLNTEVFKAKNVSNISYVDEKNITEKSATDNVKIKTKLLDCEGDIQFVSYEIEDSKDFLCELIDKIKSIEDSVRVGAIVSLVEFKECPSCHKELVKKSEHDCHLCGSEISQGSSGKNTSLLRMKNELNIQIRESEKLLDKKTEKLNELIEKRKSYRSQMRKSYSKITSIITSINSVEESIVYELYREIGEVEEKISSLDKVDELYKAIAEYTKERDVVQLQVNKLKDLIRVKKSQYIAREPEVKATISKHLINILKEDVGAESEFKKAEMVDFDFASNMISINGKTAFSESGTVYLNNAFHFSLLLASLEKDYIRIPRFMILDGIENGGMEDVRSRSFQNTIKKQLAYYDVEHQIIFATKSICKELDSSKYIVGNKFSENDKSLNFK